MRRALLAVAVLALASFAWATAGTVTTAEITRTSVKKITWTWTSGTAGEAGTATGTTTATFDGKLIGLITDPGTAAPTDNYDITITDADGRDVLLGAGADRDTANTEYVSEATLAGAPGSKLTLNVTNAGTSKEGVVILYIR